MIGLVMGSYEAYCFNEAIWYLGVTIDSEVSKAGTKPSKTERRERAAKERVLEKYLGKPGEDTGKFADPAAFFS